MASPRPRRDAVLLVALLLAGALCSCGGSSKSGSSAASAQSTASDATVRVADCRLWRQLPASGRNNLLAAMRKFFGGPVDAPHLRGQVLSDTQARSLLDNYCSRGFAGAFKLYKIYGRAAAFTPPAR